MFIQLKRLIENKKEGHMHETPIKRKSVILVYCYITLRRLFFESPIGTFKRTEIIKPYTIFTHDWIAILRNGLTNIEWITNDKVMNRMCACKVKAERL